MRIVELRALSMGPSHGVWKLTTDADGSDGAFLVGMLK